MALVTNILVGVPYHISKRYCLDYIVDWLEIPRLHFHVKALMPMAMDGYGRPGAIKESMELIRGEAIAGEYDYLYMMEADTIPPADALERLVAHNVDVVGGLYRYREPAPNNQVVAWRDRDHHKGFLHEKADLVEVDGMGMGSVLFSRKAFKLFSYMDYPLTDPDYPVYDMLKAQGFKIWLDKSVLCKHYADKATYY